jgi:oligopeptide transport system substrate-binding protein
VPKAVKTPGRIPAATLSLALIAGACGGGEPGTTPLRAPEQTAKLSELRVAITDPEFIEPSKSSTRSGLLVVKQLCDSLVGSDPATAALRPAIAETWSLTPDAKRLTLNLRPGVKFHNGRELVAEDYVYSLSRLARPQTGSPLHYLLEKVAGYTQIRSGRSATLAGVRAPGPRTLEVELIEPYAEFPAILAHPSVGAAIPKEEVARSPEGFAARPVCTGPYLLESPWTAGQDIHLTRFADYYARNGAQSRGGAGIAERITLLTTSNETAAYEHLDSGDVHVAPIPTSALAEARKVKGRVHSGPNGHVTYIGLPTRKAPFDNLNFRKALALAVDRNKIVNGLLGGSRQSATGFLPPTAGPGAGEGSCKQTVLPRATSSGAKQALSDAGINPTTIKMNVYLNEGGGHEKWLQPVLDGWKSELNIDGSLKASNWEPYLEFLAKPGADGPFRLAWSVRFPSRESLYGPLFSSLSLDNFTKYSSPEFDGILARARRTVNDTERAGIYADASRVLCREMPLIPMWFGLSHVAFSSSVTAAGKRYVDVFGDPVLREITGKK